MSAASISRMKRCGFGGTGSAQCSLPRSVAAGPQDFERCLECSLGAQRLDGDIDATAIGRFEDRGDRIIRLEVDCLVRAQPPGDGKAFGNGIHNDNQRCPLQFRAGRRSKPDRFLREDCVAVANLYVAALCAAETCRHDVGAHEHLLVGQTDGHRAQIGHGVGNNDKLGPATVDRIAELPSANGLPAMFRACPVL